MILNLLLLMNLYLLGSKGRSVKVVLFLRIETTHQKNSMRQHLPHQERKRLKEAASALEALEEQGKEHEKAEDLPEGLRGPDASEQVNNDTIPEELANE